MVSGTRSDLSSTRKDDKLAGFRLSGDKRGLDLHQSHGGVEFLFAYDLYMTDIPSFSMGHAPDFYSYIITEFFALVKDAAQHRAEH
jgi:hypothetical protein